MNNDSAFFYFLLGLLAYRAFDFIATQHKIAQTLGRLSKAKLARREIHGSARILLTVSEWIYVNAVSIALLSLLAIFGSFGIAAIASNTGSPLAPQQILSGVAVIVSIAVSFASYVNEALRLQLDRIT